MCTSTFLLPRHDTHCALGKIQRRRGVKYTKFALIISYSNTWQNALQVFRCKRCRDSAVARVRKDRSIPAYRAAQTGRYRKHCRAGMPDEKKTLSRDHPKKFAPPVKRQRTASPLLLSASAKHNNEHDGTMDEVSDASSDWDDWADAMVAQGQPADDTAAPIEGNSGACLEVGPEAEEEEAWVRSMIEQGSDGSVVQGVDSRAWDYVLQMAVEGDDRAHEWVRARRQHCNPQRVRDNTLLRGWGAVSLHYRE